MNKKKKKRKKLRRGNQPVRWEENLVDVVPKTKEKKYIMEEEVISHVKSYQVHLVVSFHHKILHSKRNKRKVTKNMIKVTIVIVFFPFSLQNWDHTRDKTGIIVNPAFSI